MKSVATGQTILIKNAMVGGKSSTSQLDWPLYFQTLFIT